MKGTQAGLIFAMGLLAAIPSAAQAPARTEKFEVASIKPVPRDRTPCGPADNSGCFSMTPWGGAILMGKNVSMANLVEMAYGVSDNQISGIERLGSEFYDILAKPENSGVLNFERAQPMLRALLEERFQLATHREIRDASGYALSIAKGGPKLKENSEAPGRSMILPGRLIGPSTTIGQLASLLSRPLGKPVVDKTGIQGAFSIDLKFAVEGDTNASRPSIFTAVQEQLGLRLESQKVPMEMLVIDHCERLLTEN